MLILLNHAMIQVIFLVQCRSETEQLLSLTEKQAQQITEQGDYIKEMEDRERILTQNVNFLFMIHTCSFVLNILFLISDHSMILRSKNSLQK